MLTVSQMLEAHLFSNLQQIKVRVGVKLLALQQAEGLAQL